MQKSHQERWTPEIQLRTQKKKETDTLVATLPGICHYSISARPVSPSVSTLQLTNNNNHTFHSPVCPWWGHAAGASWCHSQPSRRPERWPAPCRFPGRYTGWWWYQGEEGCRRWWRSGRERSQGCWRSGCRRWTSSGCQRSGDLQDRDGAENDVNNEHIQGFPTRTVYLYNDI